MCSFIFSNRRIQNLDWVGEYIARRGPDHVNHITEQGFDFVHYLLSVTGDFKPQPFQTQKQALVYNGQIYNYNHIDAQASSDGEVLLPLYNAHGPEFIQELDGEFALVLADFEKEHIIISSDLFGTKPIWYAVEGEDMGVASYKTALERLGFSKPILLRANTTLIFNLKTKALEGSLTPYQFDLRQYKSNFDDWSAVFEKAIAKRTQGVREKIFMGLSSGYDSGCIAAACLKQNVPIKAYSVLSKESKSILKQRHKLLTDPIWIRMSQAEFLQATRDMETIVEPFALDEGDWQYNLTKDSAAKGMVRILREARADNYKIFLSGQGADEITSDYGFNGEAYAPNSSLKGIFPDDLSTIFPWPNFYSHYQTAYLHKEEHVGGAFGIESRYPFLDRDLVQEFLWLTPELKNSAYKAPLHHYLSANHYPFEPGQKIGFCAHKKLVGNKRNKLRRFFRLPHIKSLPK